MALFHSMAYKFNLTCSDSSMALHCRQVLVTPKRAKRTHKIVRGVPFCENFGQFPAANTSGSFNFPLVCSMYLWFWQARLLANKLQIANETFFLTSDSQKIFVAILMAISHLLWMPVQRLGETAPHKYVPFLKRCQLSGLSWRVQLHKGHLLQHPLSHVLQQTQPPLEPGKVPWWIFYLVMPCRMGLRWIHTTGLFLVAWIQGRPH